YAFSIPSKMISEISQPPPNLCYFIVIVCKRHYHMIIAHSNGITMPVMGKDALSISFDNFKICFALFSINPCKQRCPKIKVNVLIIIYFLYNVSFFINNLSFGIWLVAFMINSFIPVMVRDRKSTRL